MTIRQCYLTALIALPIFLSGCDKQSSGGVGKLPDEDRDILETVLSQKSLEGMNRYCIDRTMFPRSDYSNGAPFVAACRQEPIPNGFTHVAYSKAFQKKTFDGQEIARFKLSDDPHKDCMHFTRPIVVGERAVVSLTIMSRFNYWLRKEAGHWKIHATTHDSCMP